jgi:hypothetical protein
LEKCNSGGNITEGIKELFPFNLRLPFVICSVSILVDTTISVLINTTEGRLKFMHRP